MPVLPIALFAFAAGATLLQWQATLPSVAPWLGVGVAAGLVAILLSRVEGGPGSRRHGPTRSANIFL